MAKRQRFLLLVCFVRMVPRAARRVAALPARRCLSAHVPGMPARALRIRENASRYVEEAAAGRCSEVERRRKPREAGGRW